MPVRHRAAGGAPINWFAVILIVAWAVGFGALAAETSRRRARNPLLWLGFGAVLGPIATLILRSAPPGYCPTCLEPTRGWLFICGWCRSDTRHKAARPRISAVPSDRSEAAQVAKPTALAKEDLRREPFDLGTPTTTSGASAIGIPAAGGAPTLEEPPETILAGSGVYVGGSAPLIPGARYNLNVRGETFDIVGPVDTAPGRLALSRRLDSIDATVIGGRLLVSAIGSGRGRFTFAFEHLADVDTVELEKALTAVSRSVADPGNAP
jgi:hypothetical protein